MHVFTDRNSIKFIASASLILTLLCNVTWAAENPFKNGWVLDTASSSLTFQTISNAPGSDDSKLENNSFDTFEGAVDESGSASLRVKLDSVVTNDDLRNVRLRFLLFETYKFGEATVSAKIDPAALSSLTEENVAEVPLEFELDLHGFKQSFQAETVVTKLADNQVSVTSAEAVSIGTSLFDLDSGVKKLEDSSNMSIVPIAAVSFELVFDTSAGIASGTEQDAEQAEAEEADAEEADAKEESTKQAEAKPEESAVPAKADDAKSEDDVVAVAVPVAVPVEIPATTEAMEVEPDWAEESETYTSPYSSPKTASESGANLSDEQCAERFRAFSQTGGIYFESSSAKLDPKSVDVLSDIVEVAKRCSQFTLTVAGHTDSTGSRESNQHLSEMRALSVSEFLIKNNVDRQRLSAVGFGETKPLVPNDTPSNRERNRRIEFSVAN